MYNSPPWCENCGERKATNNVKSYSCMLKIPAGPDVNRSRWVWKLCSSCRKKFWRIPEIDES